MFETENDISKDRRVQLIELLNQRLASAVDLQMQMKQAHWNVKGPSFIGLHELFDKVAEAVEGYVDEIAERIVQLGGVAEADPVLAKDLFTFQGVKVGRLVERRRHCAGFVAARRGADRQLSTDVLDRRGHGFCEALMRPMM